jgi:FtsZ-binding cell division protein ZapB
MSDLEVSMMKRVGELNKEVASLKAEIKELKEQPDPLTVYLYAAELAKDDMKKLKSENELLKGQVNYWKIEAECNHGRWLRCLEDMEKLRKEVAYFQMRHKELVIDKRRLSDRIEELAEEQGEES